MIHPARQPADPLKEDALRTMVREHTLERAYPPPETNRISLPALTSRLAHWWHAHIIDWEPESCKH